jgi:hypothetical protein
MDWIEPLTLETWIVQIFSGSSNIFLAVALLTIAAMAGYFRMSAIGMFFAIGMFLLMFSGYISSAFVVFMAVIVGLLIGYALSRIFAN